MENENENNALSSAHNTHLDNIGIASLLEGVCNVLEMLLGFFE